MVFKLACGDVMPGCTARFESSDRDQLVADVAGHAAAAHGLADISPTVLAVIDSKIAVSA